MCAMTTVLRALRAAAPGAVTHRYLKAVTGYAYTGVSSTVTRLRDRGVPVQSHQLVGYSLPETWRSADAPQ